jgi:hypothetical protein
MSDPYPFGQPVRISVGPITGAAGPVVPLTLTLTMYRPDGTTDVFNLVDFVADGIGYFHLIYLPPQPDGAYAWHVVATGPGAAADGDFAVAPAVPAALITTVVTLAEVKKHLNFRPEDDDDDAELAGFILAAVEAAEFHVGPVTVQTVTDIFDGGQTALVLKRIPTGPRSLDAARTLTITSITEQRGSTITTLTTGTDFTLNSRIGRIRRLYGGYPQPFAGVLDAVTVTYQTGWAVLPRMLRLGILDLVRYWWQRSQQASGMAPAGLASSADTDVAVPTEFSDLPWSVQVKWKPFKRAPGVA